MIEADRVNADQNPAAAKFWPAAVPFHRWAALTAFFLCTALCAGSVLALVAHSQPRQDDFCRASVVADPFSSWVVPASLQRPGIIPITILTYLNWSGRWAGVGLETLLLSKTHLPRAYPSLLLLLMATQFLLLYVAVWLFVSNGRSAIYLSTLIALVYWATMPSPPQGLFWIPGTIESQLPLTLGALLFAFLLSPRTTATHRSARVATAGAAGLAFVVPAFHELAGGILVFVLSVITAVAFLLKSSRKKQWLLVWLASAIGFLIVFVAPGNSIRIAATPHRGNYLVTLKGSMGAIYHYVLPWCLDFKHWLLALLLCFNSRVAALRAKIPSLSSFRAISAFILVWISLITFAIVAAFWNIGKQPPGRTMNLVYGMFLIGWITITFLSIRARPSFSFPPVYRTAIVSAALILLSAMVATSSNTVVSFRDIARGRARSWDMEMDRRFERLKSADRNDNVLLPPVFPRPRSLVWADIRSDPNFWSNRCLAQYFGVKSARISQAESGANK